VEIALDIRIGGGRIFVGNNSYASLLSTAIFSLIAAESDEAYYCM